MPGKPKVFRPAHVPSAQQAARLSDQRRGSARERGYSPGWDRTAAAYKRVHPLCTGCQALGLVVAAEVVDHIQPHKGDAALFWNAHNWQSACRWHHDTVKQQLERQYEQGLIAAAALHLDSPVAMALARSLLPLG